MKYFNKAFRIVICLMVLVVVAATLPSCRTKQETEIATEKTTASQTLSINSDNDGNWEKDYSSRIKEYRRFVDYIVDKDLESALKDEVFIISDNDLAYHWGA